MGTVDFVRHPETVPVVYDQAGSMEEAYTRLAEMPGVANAVGVKHIRGYLGQLAAGRTGTIIIAGNPSAYENARPADIWTDVEKQRNIARDTFGRLLYFSQTPELISANPTRDQRSSLDEISHQFAKIQATYLISTHSPNGGILTAQVTPEIAPLSPLLRYDKENISTVLHSATVPILGTDQSDLAGSREATLLGEIDNPIGIRIGSNVSLDSLEDISEQLNPGRLDGKEIYLIDQNLEEGLEPSVLRAINALGTRSIILWDGDTESKGSTDTDSVIPTIKSLKRLLKAAKETSVYIHGIRYTPKPKPDIDPKELPKEFLSDFETVLSKGLAAGRSNPYA